MREEMIKRFFEKLLTSYTHFFISPNGLVDITQPDKGYDNVAVEIRSLAINKNELQESNNDVLTQKLQIYFQNLLNPSLLEKYANYLYKAFDLFFNEAGRFSLIESYYDQLPHSKKISKKQLLKRLEKTPLTISKEYQMIDPLLRAEHAKSDSQLYATKLFSLFKKKLKSLFSKLSDDEINVFVTHIMKKDQAATMKMITQWHKNCIQKKLNNIDALIKKMRDFNEKNPVVKSEHEKMERYFSDVINHLVDNPDVQPMIQLVLAHPDTRIIIANGYEISTQLRSPITQFSQGPLAVYALQEKTIYLPYSGKIIPLSKPVFKGVNATHDFNGQGVSFVKVIFDEFMHAAAHLAFQQNAMGPFATPAQEKQYRLAIQNDAAHLKKLTGQTKPDSSMLHLMKTFITRSTDQLLEFNNREDYVTFYRKKEVGDTVGFQRDEKQMVGIILEKMPENLAYQEGILFSVRQKPHALNGGDYSILCKELIEDASSTLGEIAHYELMNIDVREFINRLVVGKWGGPLTSLVMPNLYAYYTQVFLPACNKALQAIQSANGECSHTNNFPDADQFGAHYISEQNISKQIAFGTQGKGVFVTDENLKNYFDVMQNETIYLFAPPISHYQNIINSSVSGMQTGFLQGIAEIFTHALKRAGYITNNSTMSQMLFLTIYFMWKFQEKLSRLPQGLFTMQSTWIAFTSTLYEITQLAFIGYASNFVSDCLKKASNHFAREGYGLMSRSSLFMSTAADNTMRIYMSLAYGIPATMFYLFGNYAVTKTTEKLGKAVVNQCSSDQNVHYRLK